LKRPERRFSFADWQKHRPSQPLPADKLDVMFIELIDAIRSTQAALQELRRDDGALRNASVGAQQLKGELVADLTADITEINATLARSVQDALSQHRIDTNEVELLAKDAERAATAGMQTFSAIEQVSQRIIAQLDEANRVSSRAEARSIESDNAANWAEAQSDNAEKFKDEALQWAEYLAGPVVPTEQAPDYIAQSPFPHGLYYQPVEGYGGMGGLWSAKWWAIQAQMIVGPWAFYYLGPWPYPPMPGQRNSQTGQVVPNPIGQGSMYYDTSAFQLYIWNGSAWVPPFVLANGYAARYTYIATAGQTIFSGADINGETPLVYDSPSIVHLNGVLQVEETGTGHGDYTVSPEDNQINFLTPLPAGAVVQWALLVPAHRLAPVQGTSYKVILEPGAPDGATTTFTMSYFDPATESVVQIATDNAALITVSLDGIIQEPAVDYVVTGNALIFFEAPRADGHLWATVLVPAATP
jgi:hypothetical protein